MQGPWGFSIRLIALALLAACARAPERGFHSDAIEVIDDQPEFNWAPWDEAWERGVDFRAVGQEPGWLLEIDSEGEMSFLGDYGEWRIVAPTPPASYNDSAEAIYDANLAEHEFTVLIWNEPCTDVMSGARYGCTVVVIVDGREYRGCGMYL